ncbi:hypothetical protein ACHAWF_016600 [Thalassiosira exigua]
MDANGDPHHEKDPDKELLEFIDAAGLVDPYHERHPDQIKTYVYGSKRIDMILMDPILVGFLTGIGYLGSHEGAFSDHVVAWADFDEERLFTTRICAPAPIGSREFRLEQTHKVKAFLFHFKKAIAANNVRSGVFALLARFWKFGKDAANMRSYVSLDRQIIQAAVAAAKKVCNCNFGFDRCPELVAAGQFLLLYKMLADCKSRGAPPTPPLERKASELNVELSSEMERTYTSLRKEVAKRARVLKKVQKKSGDYRQEWLKKEAQERAAAAGDDDWKKCLKEMVEKAKKQATNRKLSAVLKGRVSSLDRIEVPLHDWFHSSQSKEIYFCDSGNFESHPHLHGDSYHGHHSVKVLPSDATLAIVEKESDGTYTLRHKLSWFFSVETGLLYRREGKTIEVYRRHEGDVYRRTRESLLSLRMQRQSW